MNDSHNLQKYEYTIIQIPAIDFDENLFLDVSAFLFVSLGTMRRDGIFDKMRK